jgi:uncharacterized protein with HEPN domain
LREDSDRLRDILTAIARIQDRIGADKESFQRDEMLQVWAVYHLQIIGEAARSISASLRSDHPEIPWRRLIGMRHLLVHEYFGIDLSEVWSTLTSDLPQLRKQIEAIIR